MFKIISRARYEQLLQDEKQLEQLINQAIEQARKKETMHCGYKSCQFSTTDPKGLKIHRARVHRKK